MILADINPASFTTSALDWIKAIGIVVGAAVATSSGLYFTFIKPALDKLKASDAKQSEGIAQSHAALVQADIPIPAPLPATPDGQKIASPVSPILPKQ